MNKKKKCKIGLLLTIKLEIRGLYVVIRPMPFENASEKFPRSSFNIFAGCLLDKLGLAFWICFLIRRFICFMCLGRTVLTVSRK